MKKEFEAKSYKRYFLLYLATLAFLLASCGDDPRAVGSNPEPLTQEPLPELFQSSERETGDILVDLGPAQQSIEATVLGNPIRVDNYSWDVTVDETVLRQLLVLLEQLAQNPDMVFEFTDERGIPKRISPKPIDNVSESRVVIPSEGMEQPAFTPDIFSGQELRAWTARLESPDGSIQSFSWTPLDHFAVLNTSPQGDSELVGPLVTELSQTIMGIEMQLPAEMQASDEEKQQWATFELERFNNSVSLAIAIRMSGLSYEDYRLTVLGIPNMLEEENVGGLTMLPLVLSEGTYRAIPGHPILVRNR